MIYQRLRDISQRLYLPSFESVDNPEPAHPARVAEGPQLFARASVLFDRNGEPQLSLYLANAGTERLEITQISGFDLEAGMSGLPLFLEPFGFSEVSISLPKPSVPEAIELESNSRSDFFSSITPSLEVESMLGAPDIFFAGALEAWQVEDEGETCRIVAPCLDLRPTGYGVEADHVILETEHGTYRLPIRVEHDDADEVSLPPIPLFNLGKKALTVTFESQADWVRYPEQFVIEPESSTKLVLRVAGEGLQPGRNSASIVLETEGHRQVLEIWLLFTISESLEWSDGMSGRETEPSCQADLAIELLSNDLGSFPLFGDHEISFPRIPGSRQAFVRGDFNAWREKALKMDTSAQEFSLTLSMDDGHYFFQLEVDGERRIDPRNHQFIYWSEQGLVSLITHERRKRRIEMINRTGAPLDLMLSIREAWLKSTSDQIRLPESGSTGVSLEIQPRALEPGLNIAYLRIVSSDSREYVCRLTLRAIVSGPVPVITSQTHDREHDRDRIICSVFGSGRLDYVIRPQKMIELVEKIPLSNEDPTTIAHFDLETVRRSGIAHHRGSRAFFISDCYLADRRLIPLTFPTRGFSVTPGVLLFSEVYLYGKPQTITLHLLDKHVDEISVNKISDAAFLDCRREEPDRLHFTLDPGSRPSGGTLEGQVSLESSSGEHCIIPFRATVSESRCDFSISRDPEPKTGNLEAKIVNTGTNELQIQELSFGYQQFTTMPNIRKGTIVFPGEMVRFTLLPTAPRKRLSGFRVDDEIRLRVNVRSFGRDGTIFKVSTKIPALWFPG